MIRLVLVLVFSVLGHAALAQNAVEEVRARLDAGDVEGLERTLQRLHEEQKAGESAQVLREVHARLFETTHPERGKVIERWRESRPGSPYAAAAAAWLAIKRFEASGSVEKPYDEPISPTGFGAWDTARDLALGRTEEAVALAQDYVPAYDAWFRMRPVMPGNDGVRDMAEVLFALAPEAESVRIAIATIERWSPHPAQDVIDLCVTFAPKATDYDSDRCVIEAVLGSLRYNGSGLYARAVEVLEETEDPSLDWVRLHHSVWFGRPDTWNADQLIEWYNSALTKFEDLDWYIDTGRRLSHFAKRPEFLADAQSRTLAYIDTVTPDDPLNPSLRRNEAQLRFEMFLRGRDPEDLARAREAWEAGMVFGHGESGLWELGSALAVADREPWDYVPAVIFHENAVAYSGQGLFNLIFAAGQMSIASAAAENSSGENQVAADALALLQCPLLRAARLTIALCESDPMNAGFCNLGGPPLDKLPEIIARGSETCPKVAEATLSSLAYLPVPYEEVALPWN